MDRVRDGMRLGLGTGSTVAYFLEALGARVRAGAYCDIMGVPTSLWTAERARELGIPLTSLAEHPRLDLAVDGADEVDLDLRLIKGLGGALLREKMVAQAAERLIIVADERKLVPGLGQRAPLPVEVVQFGWEWHRPFLEALGAHPTLRTDASGRPVVTDNGNYILDCRFPEGIADPEALDAALSRRAGIVESGLFLGMADEALIAGAKGVDVIRREAA
ncbi:MAG: ribose 5-phosphate isomerase A [Gemmatimonadetes bacterium]|nr:MAG: ribose 5-phosphate isomerase A [Gemmatimonadota bacterium]